MFVSCYTTCAYRCHFPMFDVVIMLSCYHVIIHMFHHLDGGTGLGLAISFRLAELMGMSIMSC